VNAPRVGRRFCFGETDNKKANETGAPPPLRSAIQTVLIGGLAAAVAFMIDRVIS
jgi:hypothetical protein